jgi:hypothetical protein
MMRSPDQVMRLERLGSFHQTRLSFLRVLLRRVARGQWRFSREVFDLDAKGVGHAVYAIDTGVNVYSLIAFSHDLPPELRTDRVIAEAWDATYVLFDGTPTDADIARLRDNVPKQEAGRYLQSELILARSNKSVRLFDAVVAALSEGRQPDPREIEATGYLMRTTAVYGNGKFGIADREIFADRPEVAGPFQAEMLTVWLIRMFTADLAEHLARVRNPARAVRFDPALRRRLGIGNATGLGMAPFLVRHPALIHRWIAARETALARVRALPSAGVDEIAIFQSALDGARAALGDWGTDDAVQAPRIATLARDLDALAAHVKGGGLARTRPWDGLYLFAERGLSLEAQEYAVSLLLEPHGALIDDLAETMATDEAPWFAIDGAKSCGAVLTEIEAAYAWALAQDFSTAEGNARFWYVSEEKLEPRLGERASEPGADLEQPLAVARDVQCLARALRATPGDTIAHFLQRTPEHRHTIRRIRIGLANPYAEIRDNLIGAELRAVDLLRCKLSFFGCTRFDPRSDKWLRITLFQGAPFPDEIGHGDWDHWIWGEPVAA